MILVISPAKTLDFSPPTVECDRTQPRLIKNSLELLEVLKSYEVPDLIRLQKTSEKIALLNFERWQSFDYPFPVGQAKQALLAFKGDVYQGMDNQSLQTDDLIFAQEHLRILSGFYGLLRPLDEIYPYRLEMGNPLINPKGKDLYEFWASQITELVQSDAGSQEIVNLASQEYSAAIQFPKLKSPWIQIHFKEKSGEQYKIVGVHAKRARGLMCRYAIDHRLTSAHDLKNFNLNQYEFNTQLSTEMEWVFTR